ncbi:MAG: succinate dehydrogenase [Candidatus Thermoplasmatota archaeon]|nr:succinate dehydrogenase [Candidatus Thermoplasmatota archaeon]
MDESVRNLNEGVMGWAKFYRKGWNYFAFAMHRFSGLVIVFYLYLHLFVLSHLLSGPVTYNELVKTVTFGPFDSFLVLDVLLALVIFYHGANGTRLALNEFGIGLQKNKAMFIVFEAIAMVILGVFLYYAYMFIGAS